MWKKTIGALSALNLALVLTLFALPLSLTACDPGRGPAFREIPVPPEEELAWMNEADSLYGLSTQESLIRAAALYSNVVESAQNRGDPLMEGVARGSIGAVLKRQGDLADALRHFRSSARLSREARHSFNEIQALRGIAAVFLEMGSQDSALAYLSQAVQEARKIPEDGGLLAEVEARMEEIRASRGGGGS
jgi:tetratricopeptide (TPR) repeat protein